MVRIWIATNIVVLDKYKSIINSSKKFEALLLERISKKFEEMKLEEELGSIVIVVNNTL